MDSILFILTDVIEVISSYHSIISALSHLHIILHQDSIPSAMKRNVFKARMKLMFYISFVRHFELTRAIGNDPLVRMQDTLKFRVQVETRENEHFKHQINSTREAMRVLMTGEYSAYSRAIK